MVCLISSRGLNHPHHITNAALPSEGGGIAKRIKTARLRRKTNLQKSDYPKTRIKRGPNALCVLEYDNLYLCQITNNQFIMLIIGGREISRPYAKCEAFHIAPRLFFMFLFFIPFTIRQQSIIYPHKFSIDPNDSPNVI